MKIINEKIDATNDVKTDRKVDQKIDGKIDKKNVLTTDRYVYRPLESQRPIHKRHKPWSTTLLKKLYDTLLYNRPTPFLLIKTVEKINANKTKIGQFINFHSGGLFV